FVHAVAPLFADYRRMTGEITRDVPNAALAIARKVAGAALQENARANVEDVVTRCVQTVLAEPALTITVHESLAAALEQTLAERIKESQAAVDITVLRDAAMPVSDCRVEWKNGAFMRSTAKLWQDIERA